MDDFTCIVSRLGTRKYALIRRSLRSVMEALSHILPDLV